MGIMSLLDDQVKHGSRASDTAWLRSMNYAFTKQNSKTFNRCYKKDRIRKDIFTVTHFAGDVTYFIDKFVEKNKDRLPDTMVLCMRSSINVNLATLFANDEVEEMSTALSGTGEGRKSMNSSERRASLKRAQRKARATVALSRPRKARGTFRGNIGTLGYKFKDQLKELQTSLDATQPHFIRCVKPNSLKMSTFNEKKLGQSFDSHLSLRQLKYSGLFEVVRIRRAGFWFRSTHRSFAQRYRVLAPSIVPSNPEQIRAVNWYDVATKLIQTIERKYPHAACNDSRPWAVGKTKVFVRSCPIREELEKLRLGVMRKHVCLIQACVRMIVVKNRAQKMRAALISLDQAMEHMDESEFKSACLECSKFYTLNRHVVIATKKMVEIKELIRQREVITKGMKKAMIERRIDLLDIAIEKANNFTNINPTATFKNLQHCESMKKIIKRELEVYQKLRNACMMVRRGGEGGGGRDNELKTILDEACSLGLDGSGGSSDAATSTTTTTAVVEWRGDKNARLWCDLSKSVIALSEIVTSRSPLRSVITNIEKCEMFVNQATLSITRVESAEGSAAEKNDLELEEVRTLMKDSHTICLRAKATSKFLLQLEERTLKSVENRDMGMLKTHIHESEILLSTLEIDSKTGQSLHSSSGALSGSPSDTTTDDGDTTSMTSTTSTTSTDDGQSDIVKVAVERMTAPLVTSLVKARRALERIEREYDLLQQVIHATKTQDERRLVSSLQECSDLSLDPNDYPEIQRGQLLLERLQHAARLRSRVEELSSSGNVGRQYTEMVELLGECRKIQYRTHATDSLSREVASLVVQCRTRRFLAKRRAMSLRTSLFELEKSMSLQNVEAIVASALRVRTLLGPGGEERAEVRHARFAITFLQNKERVIRDVARAETMLETSRATTYSMTVRNLFSFSLFSFSSFFFFFFQVCCCGVVLTLI